MGNVLKDTSDACPSGLLRYLADESGATAAEYALIIALVAAAVVAALTSLGRVVGNRINTVGNSISGS
jgi:pilus assembly protein Flp/PilA